MTTSNKIFVFDINGTLLKRVKTDKPTYLKVRNADAILPTCKDLVYIRPHISKLIEFLHSNNIRYVLWTTAMEHNAIHLVNFLKKEGLNQPLTTLYYTQSLPLPDHPYKRYKDMNHLAKKYNIPVENIYLIDDEVIKCHPQSCHLPIPDYDPLNTDDTAIIDVISTITNLLN
ncbi:hypothetical protein NEOKW01_0985 [Nematocida sp. AWRm80]|nr:hypothetical protein NEOKW01_0985 [Nematocida sp. AWRm80]